MVSWRSKALFDVLLDLAKEGSPDGNSFTAGEKQLCEATGMARMTVRAYRWQFEMAGIISTEKVWSWKNEAFYERKWTLLFPDPSGLNFIQPRGLNSSWHPGLRISRYLIRKRLVALTKLYPPGGNLHNRAADADGKRTGRQLKPGEFWANAGGEKASDGQPSATEVTGKAALKVTLSQTDVRNRKCREALGRMHAALKEGWIDKRRLTRKEDCWINDAGKWGKRCWELGLSADVLRVANEILSQRKTGKPFHASPAAAAENLWQVWVEGKPSQFARKAK